MAPKETMTDRTDEAAVDQFQKELTRSGSGGGLALHFDADFAAEYELNPDTELVVEVVERDGDVTIQLDGVPAGFTYEELQEYAADRGWTATAEYANQKRDEWFVTYRTDDGSVAVEIDSEFRIDGNVVNNVTVRSDPIEVTGDFDLYNAICGKAFRKDLNVSLADSENLWERLRSAPESRTDDGPDRETFDQLSERADSVTAQFVDTRSSLRTTLDDIGDTARRMDDAYEQVCDR